MFRTDLTFGVAGAVFKLAGELRQLPAYFDNPDQEETKTKDVICDLIWENVH